MLIYRKMCTDCFSININIYSKWTQKQIQYIEIDFLLEKYVYDVNIILK